MSEASAGGAGAAAQVIAQVIAAFAAVPYPGDAFLQGGQDGDEPYDEVGAFRGRTEWAALAPDFLDARYTALSFLSEAGFRFFLPAYLVADLQGALATADPVFQLTHGLHALVTSLEVGGRTVVRRTGPATLVNPRRYGATTWGDHARRRLSAFTREEAAAIVAYLRHRGATADAPLVREQVEQALTSFWLARAATAPTAADLARHLAEEAAFAAALLAPPAAEGGPPA